MDKDQILNEIFENDPLGLLQIKQRSSNARTADDRLQASFDEINAFVEKNGNPPKANAGNISEYQLYSRLNALKGDEEKVLLLKPIDKFGLLPDLQVAAAAEPQENYQKAKTINSIEDILGDDDLDILGGDEGLFDFKHTPKDFERAEANFVARRKPCKNFKKYEDIFKEVQNDLKIGKRKLIAFKQGVLREEAFYVHNGVLFLLENINITQKEHYQPDGTRVREDGRTRCIFENGTESNMLKRSVEKILYANGKAVTENFDKVNEGFLKQFSTVTDEDEETGYIYVLRSKSKDEQISSMPNLFKIGYSKSDVAERIKHAEKEPTYLMAKVEYVAGWKCFNMNAQKFEQLIHNFFGSSCLNMDIFDESGKRFTPREWFIAPIEVIEQAIDLIISGKIVKYKYDPENMAIIER